MGCDDRSHLSAEPRFVYLNRSSLSASEGSWPSFQSCFQRGASGYHSGMNLKLKSWMTTSTSRSFFGANRLNSHRLMCTGIGCCETYLEAAPGMVLRLIPKRRVISPVGVGRKASNQGTVDGAPRDLSTADTRFGRPRCDTGKFFPQERRAARHTIGCGRPAIRRPWPICSNEGRD